MGVGVDDGSTVEVGGAVVVVVVGTLGGAEDTINPSIIWHVGAPPHIAVTVATAEAGEVGGRKIKLVPPTIARLPSVGGVETAKLRSVHESSGEESILEYDCPT